jgi:D-alanyl-D-alanine carboxypeptidase
MNGKIHIKRSMRSGSRKRQHRRRLIGFMAFAVLALALFFIGQAFLFKTPRPKDPLDTADTSQPSTPAALQSGTPVPSESVMGVATVKPENTNGKNNMAGSDWRFILVNPTASLPADFTVKLMQLKNGHAVDERCYPDLQQMMDDCRAEGLQPLICSSYRTNEKQQKLFDNKVNNLISQGYSSDEAREKAAAVIAVPGTSEHQTGLAVDMVDISNQNLDESQATTPVQKWLTKNSWKYGFILRYPAEKTGVTGISYEPWHYRYVGKEAAKEIYDQGICLEEYLGQ